MALLHHDDRVEERPSWDTPATHAPAMTEHERVVVRKNSFGQTMRTILATVLLVAVVAFAALNVEQVGIDAGFETYEAPLSAVIGISAAAGFFVGWLLGWRRCSRPHV